MADMTWLASQAKHIHEIFVQLFYVFVMTFLLIGIFIEYFKWPLGGMPQFTTLIGRALVAAILLHTFTDVMSVVGDLSDAMAKQLGDLNQIKLVLAKSREKFHTLTWSMLSVKEGLMLAVSFLAFFLLYLSVHLADACMIYVWTLLYVFSPILIALFVLPQTAGATKALYRSLIEVSFWKVVWAVLATLLWSAALSDLNKPGKDVSFIAALCFNLMLAFSLAVTPKVVRALTSGGLANLAPGLSALSAAFLTATAKGTLAFGAGVAGKAAGAGYNATVAGANQASRKYFPKAQPYVQKMPLVRRPRPRPSMFINQPKPKKRKDQEGDNG